MLRRLATIASLAALGALLLGTTAAQALIAPPTEWAVSVSGKQTLKWNFDAEIPEACEAYYGTTSQKASGSGTISLSFKSKKPIPAQTTLAGNGVKFSSFNVSGSYTAPGAITKSGKFSVINGRPCNWVEGDDLEPLSEIADNRGCGTEKGKLDVGLSWADGKFGLGAGFGMLPWGACPGPIVSDMRVLETTNCKPKLGEGEFYGESLVTQPIALDASKFIARKKFSVDTSQSFRCSFPSTWPNDAPLTIDITASYHATFKPTN